MAYRSPGRSDSSTVGAQRWAEKGIQLVEGAFDVDADEAAQKLRQAIDCFDRSMAMVPDNPEMNYHAGFALFMLMDCIDDDNEKIELADRAAANFRKLLEIRSDDEHILDIISGVLFRRGALASSPEERLPFFDEAIGYLERLIQQDLEDDEFRGKALVSLALCYAHRGANSEIDEKLERFESAVRYFEDAMEYDAVDFMMRYNYAKALLDAGKFARKPSDQLKMYNRSLLVHQDAINRLELFRQSIDEFAAKGASEVNPRPDDDEVEAAIATGTAMNFRYNYACLLSLMDCGEQAIDILKELVSEDKERIDEIRDDPDFDGIRESVEFKRLIS